MNEFEDKLHEDLHQFLLSMKEVDERLPECPDLEDKWKAKKFKYGVPAIIIVQLALIVYFIISKTI